MLLIVEVSDTTLAYVRDVMVPDYAAAGIPEVWIVDLNGERVLVHRDPRDGRYQHVEVVERGGTVTPLTFPDLSLSVEEILG
ncbi:MAG: Uma2 family endonuclease [Dehalococcoidia bacterium]